MIGASRRAEVLRALSYSHWTSTNEVGRATGMSGTLVLYHLNSALAVARVERRTTTGLRGSRMIEWRLLRSGEQLTGA